MTMDPHHTSASAPDAALPLPEHHCLAQFTAAIAEALTEATSLPTMLQNCSELVVRHLNVAFARIWTLDSTGAILELQASAGLYTHRDGPHARIPVGQFKIGLIASERRPHLSNDIKHDDRVSDPDWVRRTGMVAFAGYPLLINDRLVGVMALFARQSLGHSVLDALSLIARSLALGIERRRTEDRLQTTTAELTTRLRQQEAVARFSQLALAAAELETVLKGALGIITETLSTDLCQVLELQGDKGLLLRAGSGWPEGLPRKVVSTTEPGSLEGCALQSDQPIVARDLRTDARFPGSTFLRQQGVVSGMTVAIRGRMRPFGVLGVFTKSQRHFSQEDARFLTAMANILGAAVDRQRLEEQVLREYLSQAQLMEALPGTIVVIDRQGRLLQWNRTVERVTGYTTEDIVQMTSLDFIVPEDREAVSRAAQEVFTKGHAAVEALLQPKQGAPIPYYFVGTRLEKGGDTQLLGMGFDITERKLAEQELRQLKTAVQAAANAIVLTDRDGNIQWVNPAFSRMTGYSMEEVTGQNPRMLKSGEQDEVFYRELWNTILSGAVWRGVVCNRRKNGETYHEEMTITPIRDSNGNVTNFVAIKEDISEKVHLQTQLQQSQKMQAFGQLAGGVAHDFNNLLTVISGFSEVLLARLPANDPMRYSVKAISEAGDRAAALTRQMLAFSRQAVLAPRVLDLNGIVTETEKMLRRLIGEDVLLHTVLDPQVRPIRADPGHLGQVLMNLAVNSRDAMPRGGKLTLSTANVQLDESYAALHPDVQPGSYVLLSVSDSGCGMTPEVLERIFEPFFTTKEVGKGTGLGLAVVHGIVKQSGGTIEVASAPGQGTTFQLYFPAVKEEVIAPPSGLTPQGKRGSETILLVEDEEAVRGLAQLVLRTHGYQVLTASNGHEALRLAEQHGEQIALLVTDVVMPRMSGSELARTVQARFPGMKVLFVSGYTDDAVLRHGLQQEEVEFLQKPYTASALTHKVRELLDQGTSS